ncbi:hypothetical protein [Roseovarius pacificus]|uniref:hypothetical protein n=1 Tax=Roseovarius pacificus TaxID=337701 RepID=UPI002A1874DB|nr:hypothetical protein [Roseovarius pacificus]
MTKPQFSMTFNFGHLLQIGTVVIAATVGWVTMDARTSSNKESISNMQRDLTQAVARIRSVETSSIRADERLQNIFGLLSRIDARLERIEGK